jgi:ketosteroid isomerase-like protein
MPCPSRTAVAALALLGACTSRAIIPRGTEAAPTPNEILALARLAVSLDATGDRGADTLYTPDAVVVANARVRVAAPPGPPGPPARLAGVGNGGRVTVTATTVTLQGRFAWVLLDYRWINAEQRLAEAGRATFVFERRERGWKIVHLHSSQVLPWDR